MAGLTAPQPRPPVATCSASAAQTPAAIVASAPDADVLRTYSPAMTGTNSDTPTSV